MIFFILTDTDWMIRHSAKFKGIHNPLRLCWMKLGYAVLLNNQDNWDKSKCFRFHILYLASYYRKVRVLVAQSCPTLCNPIDCESTTFLCPWNPPARILEWVAIPFSGESSRPRDRVSCTAGRFFTIWATREALLYIDILPYFLYLLYVQHKALHKLVTQIIC